MRNISYIFFLFIFLHSYLSLYAQENNKNDTTLEETKKQENNNDIKIDIEDQIITNPTVDYIFSLIKNYQVAKNKKITKFKFTDFWVLPWYLKKPTSEENTDNIEDKKNDEIIVGNTNIGDNAEENIEDKKNDEVVVENTNIEDKKDDETVIENVGAEENTEKSIDEDEKNSETVVDKTEEKKDNETVVDNTEEKKDNEIVVETVVDNTEEKKDNETVVDNTEEKKDNEIVVEPVFDNTEEKKDNETVVDNTGEKKDNEIVVDSTEEKKDDETVVDNTEEKKDNEIVVETVVDNTEEKKDDEIVVDKTEEKKENETVVDNTEEKKDDEIVVDKTEDKKENETIVDNIEDIKDNETVVAKTEEKKENETVIDNVEDIKDNETVVAKTEEKKENETVIDNVEDIKDNETIVDKSEDKKENEAVIDNVEDIKDNETVVDKTEEKKENETVVDKGEDKKDNGIVVDKGEDIKDNETVVDKIEEKKENETVVDKGEDIKDNETVVDKTEEKKENETVVDKGEDIKDNETVVDKTEEKKENETVVDNLEDIKDNETVVDKTEEKKENETVIDNVEDIKDSETIVDKTENKKDSETIVDKTEDEKDNEIKNSEKDTKNNDNSQSTENKLKEQADIRENEIVAKITELNLNEESLKTVEKIWKENKGIEKIEVAIVTFLSNVLVVDKQIARHLIKFVDHSEHVEVKKMALDRLTEAIPVLVQIKNSDDSFDDHEFVNILSRMDSEMAISGILVKYAESNKKTKLLIDQVFVKMGEKGLNSIIEYLRINPSKEVKEIALATSYNIGVDTIPMILPLLGDLNPFIQDYAKSSLKKFGQKTLPSLTLFIKTNKNDENIALAISVIGDMGEEAKSAIPILRLHLKKEGPTKLAAAVALKKMKMHAYVALDDFISNLRARDWQVRQTSAETIGDFGSKSSKAVQPLIRQFRREEYGIVRASISLQFGKIGIAGKKAIPLLIKALQDEDEMVVKSASESLGEFGKDAKQAIKPLTEVLVYYGVNERVAAAKALAKIGPKAVSVLNSMVRFHEDPAGREGAAMALGYMGSKARRSVRILTAALKYDEAEAVKIAAADALGKVGDRYAIRALIDAVRNDSYIVRQVASGSLVKIGHSAVIDITRSLKRPGTDARIALVSILGELGKNAIPSVGTLNSCLDLWHGKEREQLVITVGKIGKNKRSVDTLKKLILLLENEADATLSSLIVETLKQFGAISIPYVIPLLKSENNEIVSSTQGVVEHLIKEAFSTLQKIIEKGEDEILTAKAIEIVSKDKKSLPFILKSFKNENSLVYVSAKNSIIKNIGEIAIPGLIQIMETTVLSRERNIVAETLGGIGKESVPSLINVIALSENKQARFAAIFAVTIIGSKAKDAISILQESIKIRQGVERGKLAICLGKIGTQAIPKILELLEHPDSGVQNAAIDALGETGAKDSISYLLGSLKNKRLLTLVIKAMTKMPKLSIPTLMTSLENEDETIRFACAAALFEISPTRAIAPLAQRILIENDPMVKYMLQTALTKCQDRLENTEPPK